LDDITDRKRAEESLQRRLQFETLLAEMSTNFISLRPADIDAEINRTLHRLAEHVGVERCNIWQKHEEESFYTVSHSWTKPGFKSLSNMTSAEYPWYRDNMQIDQAIIVRNVNDIPSEALKDKKSFLNREAVSALAVPMAAQGSIIGVLSLTSMTKELEWPPGLVKRVKLIAEVITNALLNRRANKAVMETTHQLKAEREQLEKKNIALKQILNHMDQKKTDFKNEICESVENLLMPTIIKLLKNDGCLSGKDLDILQHNLDSIIGRDLNQFKNNYKTLTARELDICKGVREGMSSKEIANMLCISPETVQKHRESTRRKLQIKHRSINLTTFLRTKLNDQD
ncbi:MAG: GAF domain-containing protein, partial [FCB group bacterium]|nr:GAF domain-containing protein [FCB group bacterium]